MNETNEKNDQELKVSGGFVGLHTLDEWEQIAKHIWKLEQLAHTLNQQTKNAGRLASDASTLLFLKSDPAEAVSVLEAMGDNERPPAVLYNERIADLEKWTADLDRWNVALAELLITNQDLRLAITGLEHYRKTNEGNV